MIPCQLSLVPTCLPLCFPDQESQRWAGGCGDTAGPCPPTRAGGTAVVTSSCSWHIRSLCSGPTVAPVQDPSQHGNRVLWPVQGLAGLLTAAQACRAAERAGTPPVGILTQQPTEKSPRSSGLRTLSELQAGSCADKETSSLRAQGEGRHLSLANIACHKCHPWARRSPCAQMAARARVSDPSWSSGTRSLVPAEPKQAGQ